MTPSFATWWLARAESQLPPVGEWLTPAERSRAEGLRYSKRRTDFLLGRWALKVAVARVRGWPEDPATLARIEGRSAPDGAPELYVDGLRIPGGCRSVIGLAVRSAWWPRGGWLSGATLSLLNRAVMRLSAIT